MYLLNGNKITDTGFQTEDGTSYPPNWIALATVDERTAIGIIQVNDPVMPDSRLGSVSELNDGSYAVQPYTLDVVVNNCCNSIDDAVASVYDKWTRFEAEYDKRLTAAQAYVAAGYTGTADPYLASFATAANIDLTTAANTVVAQGTAFAQALSTLAALRMRKFEIKRVAQPADALPILDDILSQVNAIGSQLS